MPGDCMAAFVESSYRLRARGQQAECDVKGFDNFDIGVAAINVRHDLIEIVGPLAGS